MRPNLTNWIGGQHNTALEPTKDAHLLLLHELGVGAVIDNILAENWGGQGRINLLCVDILDLAVEDKVVALGIEAYCHFTAEENECENVAILHASVLASSASPIATAYLLLVGEKELVGIDAIGDCAANDREEVKDYGWLVGILEQQLVQYIQDDSEGEKGGETGDNQDGERGIGGKGTQWAGDISENTHVGRHRHRRRKRERDSREGRGAMAMVKGERAQDKLCWS